MMSAPLPDWMAAVMRAWRSLALMNSKVTSAPSAFEASGAWRLSSTSASGMKSTQRRMWILVPWAKAGARRAARMPSSPAAPRPTAADPAMNRRRVTPAVAPCPSRSGVFIDPSSPRLAASLTLALVDLLELAFRPLHGVLGLHALDALGIHVGHDVLREALGGLGRGRPRIAEETRVAGRRAEHLEGLVELAPHGVVLPLLGAADAVSLLGGEPLAVVLRLVEPAEEILGELLVLGVLHDRVRLVEEEQVRARGAGGQWGVADVLEEGLALVVLELLLLSLGHDIDAGAVEG